MELDQALLAPRLMESGLTMVGMDPRRQKKLNEKRLIELFRSNFGLDPSGAAAAFIDLQTTTLPAARVDKPSAFYFLLALNWLKAYQLEDQMYTRFGKDIGTMRTQIKIYVDAISALKAIKIVWTNAEEERFVLSVDGVHFRIQEPRNEPSANWCSHKHKSAGLGYEIGVLIWHNQVAWAEGPFQAATHDKTKYQEKDGLQSFIPEGKLVVGDRGYTRSGSNNRVVFGPIKYGK